MPTALRLLAVTGGGHWGRSLGAVTGISRLAPLRLAAMLERLMPQP